MRLKHNMKRWLAAGMAAVCALGVLAGFGGTVMAADGGTGSITVNGSGDGMGVAGKTFAAYRIFSAELAGDTKEDGIVYRVPDVLKPYFVAKYDDIDGTEKNFDQLVQEKVFGTGFTDTENPGVVDTNAMQVLARDLVENAATELESLKVATKTGAADATSVVFDGLSYGYYMIVDTADKTPVSALILTTVAPDATVNLKGSLPTLTKKIEKDGEKTDFVNEAVGNTVNFVLDTKVPDMTGYLSYAFAISDVMSSGLTLVENEAGLDASFDITMGEKKLVAGTDYTVVKFTDPAGQGYRIVFKNFIQYKGNDADLATSPSHEGEAIVVKYSATLNDNAVIGVNGNPNTANLIYSNNPQVSETGKPDDPKDETYDGPVGETEKDTVRVFVTGLQILKKDEDGKALAGAQFVLEGTALNRVKRTGVEFAESADGTWYALKDGSFTETAPTDNTSDSYADTTKKYEKRAVDTWETTTEHVVRTLVSNEEGKISIAGLMAGDYTLTEVAPPAGYNALTGPVAIHIGWSAPADDTAPCTWTGTYQMDGEEGTSELTFSPEGAEGMFSMDIVNQSGQELPGTGGMGTKLFYMIGGVLVILAGIGLVVRRRSR